MISRQLLLELRQIIKEERELVLTLEEVTDIATTLIGFTETLLKIEAKTDTKNKNENDYEKQRQVQTI